MCPALNGHSARGPTLLDRSHRVALDSLAFYLSGGGRIVCPMLILLVFLILCILLFGASAVLGVLGGRAVCSGGLRGRVSGVGVDQ